MDRMGRLTHTAAASLVHNSNNNSSHGEGQREDSGASSVDNTANSVVGGGAVKLLNFAYISLDKNKQLGTGSFSRVYRGKYRKQSCAVKLIFTLDLTLDVIKRVAAEAQLLSLIRHPNVVDILGVSVLPPSVCILLELCINGSLGDMLRNNAAMTSTLCGFNPVLVNDGPYDISDGSSLVTTACMRGFINGFNSFISYNDVTFSPTGYDGNNSQRSVSSNANTLLSASTGTGMPSNSSNPNAPGSTYSAPTITPEQIQALSINWTDRLFLAVGCARGLAALHKFSDDLCHRDIKSFNFLIDQQLNAKISDLELGMAELLNSSQKKSEKRMGNKSTTSIGTNLSELGASIGAGDEESNDSEVRQSLAASEILANWAAPEVLQGDKYTQAADVYSFALVLWEILVGRVPFSDIKRQDDIRRKVLEGHRPMIPACFTTGEFAGTFAGYVDLIQRGWSGDVEMRPTSSVILAELEDMWHRSLHPLISSTDATYADEAYAAYRAGGLRTGHMAGEDPGYISSVMQGAGAGAGGGTSSNPSTGDIVGGFSGGYDDRPSVASDASFSRSSSYWAQGSFAFTSPFRSTVGGAGVAAVGGLANPTAAVGGSAANASMSSSGVGSLHSPAPNAPMFATFAHKVLDNLRREDDGASLHALESSGGCYVLVLPVPPHEIVWASLTWCTMAGCLLDDIVGKPLHSQQVFDADSFVKLKSGSQRKGSLEAELEAPRSRCTELINAVSSLWGGEADQSAVQENAAATSLFFKSLNFKYLHRAKTCHAIINLLDFSSRSWNMTANTRKNANTITRKIAASLTGVARRRAADAQSIRTSLVSNPLAAQKGGNTASKSARSKHSATAAAANSTTLSQNTLVDGSSIVNSVFSVHAFPVYQRTVASSAVAIPSAASSGKTAQAQKAKSATGYFNMGAFAKSG